MYIYVVFWEPETGQPPSTPYKYLHIYTEFLSNFSFAIYNYEFCSFAIEKCTQTLSSLI